ncbi:hypothetical protein [Arsenophonus endosymbiont of Aphis craccivora]|uniref:hypothetical protein n=1 Tax=Arsenophonus endosymbiont of Aphis craccivora TaxID=1231049 RepID=UPI0015E0224B|nr:hypothetical protein [Arsenophonus endosymbiont of Aphis craccivora]
MPWGPDVETNLAISSANHLKVRFIQQSLKRHKKRFIDSAGLRKVIYIFIV